MSTSSGASSGDTTATPGMTARSAASADEVGAGPGNETRWRSPEENRRPTDRGRPRRRPARDRLNGGLLDDRAVGDERRPAMPPADVEPATAICTTIDCCVRSWMSSAERADALLETVAGRRARGSSRSRRSTRACSPRSPPAASSSRSSSRPGRRTRSASPSEMRALRRVRRAERASGRPARARRPRSRARAVPATSRDAATPVCSTTDTASATCSTSVSWPAHWSVVPPPPGRPGRRAGRRRPSPPSDAVGATTPASRGRHPTARSGRQRCAAGRGRSPGRSTASRRRRPSSSTSIVCPRAARRSRRRWPKAVLATRFTARAEAIGRRDDSTSTATPWRLRPPPVRPSRAGPRIADRCRTVLRDRLRDVCGDACLGVGNGHVGLTGCSGRCWKFAPSTCPNPVGPVGPSSSSPSSRSRRRMRMEAGPPSPTPTSSWARRRVPNSSSKSTSRRLARRY